MKFSHVLSLLSLGGTLGVTNAESFFGFDMCPGECMTTPLSDNAYNTFLQGLLNPEIESLESFPTGLYASIPITSFTQVQGSVTLAGPNLEIRSSPGAGRFPITGAKFLETIAGASNAFNVQFGQPVAAFGFYGIDLGDFQGTITLITSTGGGNQKFYPLDLTGATNGDVIFFGVIDTDLFDKVEFTSTTGNGDYFGFDNFVVADLEFIDDRQGMEGDPHLITWNHKMFDYMGMCDLVLLSNPNFTQDAGLDIHVRTTIRYDYSYIESAALRIGDEVLEVGSFGDWTFNGVNHADLGAATISGFPIYHTIISDKQQKFDVVVGTHSNITLSCFKDMVSVMIKGTDKSRWANSTGMMGSLQGELVARDGKTVMEDVNKYGQEWQVRDTEDILFRTPRHPQFPDLCVLPSVDSTMQKRRRLGEKSISKEMAEKACEKAGQLKVACVFDVLSTNDIEVAGAF